jgi:hypothetical protein
MSLVETYSLLLNEEQRERFLMLIEENPDTHVFYLFQKVINTPEP